MVLAVLLLPAAQAEPLSYYLPEGEIYDPAIPTPAEVLGFEVGEWHARHDQLVEYMKVVAAASDRVILEETGRSHENRSVFTLTITAPENHARLDEIRQRHVALTDPELEVRPTNAMPVVVWLCYSVHGNEASGSNASLLTVYHLAASRSAETEALLRESVILIDPSLNPDGMSRFAHWVNTNRGAVLVDDPEHREHREAWPGGRTNHYWFDLNRDWLLLTHPESRARVQMFHHWKPNILCDFHEMGTNSTYFFQPGVPSRRNPVTPEENEALTRRIAQFHARAFDAQGRLYYSEESFDDFYYGKGSTYPDGNGAVGILFEQASARGHMQQSVNGRLTFPFAILNQFTTSLSTLTAAREMRGDLLDYQKRFYNDAVSDAPSGAYVFGDAADPARTYHMADILLHHDIEIRALTEPQTRDGITYVPGSAYVVPRKQPQARLVEALFEERTAFPDSLFYDVSAWTLAHSFGIPFAEVTGNLSASEPLDTLLRPEEAPVSQVDPYAYAFAWTGYYAPRALYRLQSAGVRTRVATREFEADTDAGRVAFAPGSIVVPMGIQTLDANRVERLMQDIAEDDAVHVLALSSGLTPGGIDLGSPSARTLDMPRPLIVVGSGVSSYEAGEAWHLLDRRMGMAVSLVEARRLGSVDLGDYTHVIMVNGRYRDLDEDDVESLKQWVRNGGVLVATKSAVRWANDQELVDVAFVDDKDEEEQDEDGDGDGDGDDEDEEPPVKKPYADNNRDRGAQFTSGAIFNTYVDGTHPIGFGYTRPTLPVFRNSNLYMKPGDDPYVTVAHYTEEPLLAGYISEENLEKLRGTVSAAAHRLGAGTVVLLLDNPNFRGVWYGTSKLFLNALFFGAVVDNTGD